MYSLCSLDMAYIADIDIASIDDIAYTAYIDYIADIDIA